tara:strand:- start:286 stop:924 length:639 start_codon:yes stop_codon:yes gene_type:complete
MIKRNIFFTVFLIVLSSLGKSLSQGWFNYSDEEWFFSVNFPNEPEIEEIIYASEWGGFYPGRVYTVEHNSHFYSLTVINYNLDENVAYSELSDVLGTDDYPGLAIYDRKGSIAYAASNIRSRGVDITHDAWGHINFINGHQLHTINEDNSISTIGIYFHSNQDNVNNNYLYILEGRSPEGYPPSFFYQSLEFLDENGKSIRYTGVDSSVRQR